jgi:hypothetical protein
MGVSLIQGLFVLAVLAVLLVLCFGRLPKLPASGKKDTPLEIRDI